MDDVLVKGIKYISSKQAAHLTGYAKDYIGQLVRMNKLRAIKVGRAWFVDEKEVLSMVKKLLPASMVTGEAQYTEKRVEASVYQSTVTASVSFPRSWGEIKYMQDDSPLLPNSDSRDMAIKNDFFLSSAMNDAEQYRINLSKKATYIEKNFSHAPEKQETGYDYSSIDGVRVSVRSLPTQQMGVGEDVTHQNIDAGNPSARPMLLIGSAQSQSQPTFVQTAARVLLSAFLVALIVFFVPLLA